MRADPNPVHALGGNDEASALRDTSRRDQRSVSNPGVKGTSQPIDDGELQKVQRETTDNNEAESRATEQEIEGTEVCGPQLFFRADVAGLIVPTTVVADGRPAGRWLLCLQWHDGKRESLALPEQLELASDGRLWFTPIPRPPPPNVGPGWSAEGRKRWLEGESPDANSLFQALCEQIYRFVVFPEENASGESSTLALWIMLTYCYPAWEAVPYLPVAGTLASGKSRLIDLLSHLVWRPISFSSITASVLFRTLHDQGGTLLLDEAESLRDHAASSELRTVLRAGYRAGGRVARSMKDGNSHCTIHFDVFGPKVLGGIRDLLPALASRCIRLNMLRAPGDCPQVRARLDAKPSAWQRLRDDLHAFVLSHAGEIVQSALAANDATTGMSGRNAELWQPLLALADLCECSGADGLVDRVRRFADCVIADSQDDVSPEPEMMLLEILAEWVCKQEADVMPKDVLERARKNDPVTFARWTPHSVASALRRYGLLTHKTSGGRRSYHRVTQDQLHRVERQYGIHMPRSNATFATDATCRRRITIAKHNSQPSQHLPGGDGGDSGIYQKPSGKAPPDQTAAFDTPES